MFIFIKRLAAGANERATTKNGGKTTFLLYHGLALLEHAEYIVAGSFGFLLVDSLLYQILRRGDGVGHARYRDDAVAGAGRESALLGNLDVSTAEMLDLDQRTPARPQNSTYDILPYLQVYLFNIFELAGRGTLAHGVDGLLRAQPERIVIEREGGVDGRTHAGGARLVPERVETLALGELPEVFGALLLRRRHFAQADGADGPEDAVVADAVGRLRRRRVHRGHAGRQKGLGRAARQSRGTGQAEAHAQDAVGGQGAHGRGDLHGGLVRVAAAAQRHLDVLEQLRGERRVADGGRRVQVQTEVQARPAVHRRRARVTDYATHCIDCEQTKANWLVHGGNSSAWEILRSGC